MTYRIDRRTVLRAAIALPFVATTAPAVLAQQAFPSRQPIRIMVSFAPGGNADVTTRIIAARMTASLGQSVVSRWRVCVGQHCRAQYFSVPR